ncbi:hypothetical protein DV872_02460 [Oceanispirochaeta sp. M1]|nr:hypothetical protein DV872_02460 [Oceanispirochaeta sp. M1]
MILTGGADSLSIQITHDVLNTGIQRLGHGLFSCPGHPAQHEDLFFIYLWRVHLPIILFHTESS